MRWLLIAAAFCGTACTIEDSPIGLPFVDVGWTYKCEVAITCDSELMIDTVNKCGAPSSYDVAIELTDDCLERLGPELGCSAWSCSVDCKGESYCTL